RCPFGKSPPTTATSRTRAKKEAAYEKKVAEPPSTSSALPNGVRTESSATEPTTSRSATASYPFRCRAHAVVPARRPGEVLADQELQAAAGRRREGPGGGDDSVSQQLRTGARPRRAHRRHQPAQHLLGRGDVLQKVGHYRFDRDRRLALVPDVVIGHQ